MSRVFVTDDAGLNRIEIRFDVERYSEHHATCETCGEDVVAEHRERWNFEDTTDVAMVHADQHATETNRKDKP